MRAIIEKSQFELAISEFETSLNNFILEISETYNISQESLIILWSKRREFNIAAKKAAAATAVAATIVKPTNEVIKFSEDLSAKDLLKLKKPELQQMCREKGKRTVGTKVQLVEFLLNCDISEALSEKSPSPDEKPVPKKIVSKTSTTKQELPVAEAVKKNSGKLSLQLRKNKDGLYVHSETNFVFDTNMTVYGKYNVSTSKVSNLTDDDIQECKRLAFKYTIPENLDENIKVETTHIDELEDEEKKIVNEESEIVEEELIEEDEVIEEEELIEEEEDDIIE